MFYTQEFNQDAGILNLTISTQKKWEKFTFLVFFKQVAIEVLNCIILCNVSHVIKLIQG